MELDFGTFLELYKINLTRSYSNDDQNINISCMYNTCTKTYRGCGYYWEKFFEHGQVMVY